MIDCVLDCLLIILIALNFFLLSTTPDNLINWKFFFQPTSALVTRVPYSSFDTLDIQAEKNSKQINKKNDDYSIIVSP